MGRTIHLSGGGRIELIDAGFIEMLHEVGRTVCKEEAEKICKRCGEGYATDLKVDRDRTKASVYTATTEAMADNKAHNTLAGAIR